MTPASTPMDVHLGGKIHVTAAFPLNSRADLSRAYTPGVAEVSRAIARDPSLAFTHTIKSNSVAVVTDGTAVLGLGDIGPLAAEPVMAGKAMLFNEMAGVDAFPICLDTKDPDEIVRTVKLIAPVFGGINLEDISAPRCFDIEERLDAELDIPVFHDDQHGTSVVVLAALTNSLRMTDREWGDLRVVVLGAGAAGVATTRMLLSVGAGEVVVFDRAGAIHRARRDLTGAKRRLAETTNPRRLSGGLASALRGADVFIGVSGPGLLRREDLMGMRRDAIVLAMANPVPEIYPDDVEGTPVRIVGTGRSDYPNQVNNVLAFPGIFRGALDAGATTINAEMKLAAARAIAGCVSLEELAAGRIVPDVLDRRVAPAVAAAVAAVARRSGVTRAPQ
ncbi:MAG TPA: NADP-dependent malic enzyme [Gaiellales bacterium]|nr:NADP-dependent malic enzyme [Gaiellales bacterium]